MKKYKYIFFDLDHTLWDFEKNSSLVLKDLFEEHQISSTGENITLEAFLEEYEKVNHQLWALYNKDEISKEDLRDSRFTTVIRNLGGNPDLISANLGEVYLEKSPHMPHVFPNTFETLEALKSQYPLYIITNGFEEVQHIKMEASKLAPYFEAVFTSEKAGYKKPHKGIFNFAMETIEAQPEECIMIGDNFDTDIAGAKKAQIDHIFFNPTRKKHGKKIQHEVHDLIQILDIL
ncbi:MULTISPECIES: YjjG family noncanonical pyrimidine nucleotidase [Persicobacter]|uniref:Noncanonical pyrimidine nucleotidase, YjjG family protein n=1 Tax=Persicobacter diffluens TaxID=981 RepID=A0AAN4VWP4_9BACT|nr:YjjG family noncanonical pyrimidine nucleotidase [Persicobacter sp. CCB-QB2]GJM60165.1 noncanonical pyrimidine nucleotidase, YjjG family protein [Persicobacter diffluens]